MNGIYKITNIKNGKIYIGSTVNLKARERNHWSKLKNNIHANPHLQSAYNKYGQESFIFEILEQNIEPEKLIELEQQYLNNLKPFQSEIGYNIALIAFRPMIGRTHSVQTREKLSKINFGKKHSEITKLELSKYKGNLHSQFGKRQEFCKRGHEATDENSYFSPKNKRECKFCKSRNSKEKYFKKKTHCPKGHEYFGDNFKVGAIGQRVCLRCENPFLNKKHTVETKLKIKNTKLINKTHCSRNHEFILPNYYLNSRGNRVCKLCVNINYANRTQRKENQNG